jgi:hypothetical protein
MTCVMSFIVVFYVGSYLAFRVANSEVWEHDRRAYVMFPPGVGAGLYYLWRPLSYLDGALTGMRFHIGPHRL